MDATTTPPSSNRTKSASRLSKLRYYSESPIPNLSLDLVPLSPKPSTPSPASTISPRPPYTAPLRELLMFSPSQVARKSKRIADEAIDRKQRTKKNCSPSPRNARRSARRRIVEQEVREEEEVEDEGLVVVVKPRKKRRSGKSKKDKAIVVIPQSPTPKENENDDDATEVCNFDRIGVFINDLVMWRDVSKSSLWFGFGSLCFISSCFTRGVSFSLFSFLSQVGLFILGLSFLSNTLRPRDATNETKSEFKLTEEDILKVGKLLLPAANLMVAKARQVFSGEPSMTLKVIPFMILGAEFGHLITLWRLLALGFFISFTCPILYTAYSAQLSNKVECVKGWALQAWGSCTHKKIVAASVVSAFWNLTSVRTRIFAAFLCLVVLRYHKQHSQETVEVDVPTKPEGGEQQQETKESVAVELEATK